jgi:DNA polymerase-3 subunit delta'
LQNALKSGRVGHAYCFHGPGGTGKRRAALELAKALNCEEERTDPCDRCSSCRRIEHGNHPDVVTVKPDGAFIKIDQLRALQQAFRYSAPPGIVRVVVIEEAEKMRSEAANSLLKFLEEPVSPMVAVLVTENVSAVLPTILSRCQIIRFTELPPSVKEKHFAEQGMDPEAARVLAHLPEEAVRVFREKPEEIFTVADQLIDWGRDILVGKAEAIPAVQSPWLSAYLEKGQLPILLDLFLLWLRDLLHAGIGGQDPVFRGRSEEIKRDAFRFEEAKILLAMDNVLIARRLATRGHYQAQALLEQMVLAIQDERLSAPNDWRMIVM